MGKRSKTHVEDRYDPHWFVDPNQTATAAKLLMPILVAFITFATFAPSLHNQFVNWDEQTYLLNNPSFRGLSWPHIKWMFTTFMAGPYQPLCWLSFAVDYLVWGMRPLGFHLTSLIWHSLNAWLFYLLSLTLLRLGVPASQTPDRIKLQICAALSALLFAVHPLRVQTVAWAIERKDVLAGFFYLLTILCHLRAVASAQGSRSSWWWRGASLVSFLLSLLSKGITVSLPVTLIILDAYPLGRFPSDVRQWLSSQARSVWIEKVPYLLLALTFGLVGLVAQSHAGAVESLSNMGIGQRVAQAAFDIIFYLRKTVAPINLLPAYRMPDGFGLLSRPSLVSALASLVITMAAFLLRKRFPSVFWVWVFYLATLAPVLGVVKFGAELAADRYTYLACLGWPLLIGGGILERWSTAKRGCGILVAGAGIAVIALALLSWRQTKIWHDSESLWRYAIRIDPHHVVYHTNLGVYLTDQGRWSEAVDEYQQALTISPGQWRIRYRLGDALMAQGRFAEATEQYQVVLQSVPSDGRIRENLGIALMRQGRANEALKYFREALRLSPDDADTMSNLCGALNAQGSLDEAQELALNGLRKDPRNFGLHFNLGLIFVRRGNYEAAVGHFRAAVDIDPQNTNARRKLAEIAQRLQGR